MKAPLKITIRKIGRDKIEFWTNSKEFVKEVVAVRGQQPNVYFVFPTHWNIKVFLAFAELLEANDIQRLQTLQKILDSKNKQAFLNNLDYGVLRDYQKHDLETLINFKNGANFSEQRTGKTPTSLMLAKNLGLKFIVVCPSSLQFLTWEPQIKQFLGIKPLLMFDEKENKKGLIRKTPLKQEERLERYREFFTTNTIQAMVISKDTWRNDYTHVMSVLEKADPFTLIIDEAHFLKEQKSPRKGTKQSQALFLLSQKAAHTYLLSGTPSSNHPADVFGMLFFIDNERFSSFWGFADYFWGLDYYFKPKYKYRSPLFEQHLTEIVQTYSVMHKQVEVMGWLPPIIKERVHLPMLKHQAEQYYDAFVYEKYHGKEAENVLTQLTWLRQISNVAIDINGQFIESNKIAWLKQYVAENPDENIMVLSNYSNKTIPYIAAELSTITDTAVITGATSKDEMQRIIDAVQNGWEKCLIANIKVVKEGITLDALDTIIFFDRAYNPADNAQVEARILPVQKSDKPFAAKRVIDLVSDNPVDIEKFAGQKIYKRLKMTLVDEQVLDLLEQKINITEYLNRLGRVWKEEHESDK